MAGNPVAVDALAKARALYGAGDHAGAVIWYGEAARAGNADGLYELANCHVAGEGVGRDMAEAARLYLRAADLGHAAAENALGNCYFNGAGVPRDLVRAVECYDRAAGRGHPGAAVSLALCLMGGTGTTRDLDRAAELLTYAAEVGLPEAQYVLARLYRDGEGVERDPGRAVVWFRRAAEQGHVQAALALGRALESGLGGVSEMREAVHWYRFAATQGLAEAQHQLANCYFRGKGVQANLEEALSWERRAADQDHPVALFNLGVCYDEGRGLPRDALEAANLYRRSAALGTGAAALRLALMHLEGRGVPRDAESARRLLAQAAEAGSARARSLLAELPESGVTSPPALLAAAPAAGAAPLAGEGPAADEGAQAGAGSAPRPMTAPLAEPVAVPMAAPAFSGEDRDSRTRRPALGTALERLDALVGLAPVKERVRQLANLARNRRRRQQQGLPLPRVALNQVLIGPPGTGKTLVARLIGEIFAEAGLLSRGHVVSCSRVELLGGTAEDSAAKAARILDNARGGTLIVQAPHVVAPPEAPDSPGHGAIRLLAERLSSLDDDMIVVLTGLTRPMRAFLAQTADLAEHFAEPILFAEFSAEELFHVFAQLCRNNHFVLQPTAAGRAQRLLAEMHAGRDESFGNGRVARLLYETVVARQASRLADAEGDLEVITPDDIPEPAGPPPDERALPLERMVGQSVLKAELLGFVTTLKAAAPDRRQGLPDFSHLVFAGRAGTGKTSAARMLGEHLADLGLLERGHLVECDPERLVAGSKAETERRVVELTSSARGGLLFVDDAHLLGRAPLGEHALSLLGEAMEEAFRRLLVVLSGPAEAIEGMLRARPRLRRLIARTVLFTDFSPSELLEMFARQAQDSGLGLTDLARDRLRLWFSVRQQAGGVANLHLVAHTFDEVMAYRAVRLGGGGGGGSAQTIEGADIPDPRPGGQADLPLARAVEPDWEAAQAGDDEPSTQLAGYELPIRRTNAALLEAQPPDARVLADEPPTDLKGFGVPTAEEVAARDRRRAQGAWWSLGAWERRPAVNPRGKPRGTVIRAGAPPPQASTLGRGRDRPGWAKGAASPPPAPPPLPDPTPLPVREGGAFALTPESERRRTQRRLTLFFRDHQTVLEAADGASLVVGRGVDCGLKVASLKASRRHATIWWEGRGFKVRDHSANGTMVIDPISGSTLIHEQEMALPASGQMALGGAPTDAPDGVISFTLNAP